MTDFSDLSARWVMWAGLAGVAGASAVSDPSGQGVRFISAEQSFDVRHDGSWWVLDETDDRGQKYVGTAQFSTLELMEKYLTWKWSAFARTARGLPALGPQLYQQGFSADVSVSSTNSEWLCEITNSTGSAVLPQPDCTIFSHLMAQPLSEIDRFVGQGIVG